MNALKEKINTEIGKRKAIGINCGEIQHGDEQKTVGFVEELQQEPGMLNHSRTAWEVGEPPRGINPKIQQINIEREEQITQGKEEIGGSTLISTMTRTNQPAQERAENQPAASKNGRLTGPEYQAQFNQDPKKGLDR